jgi:hypothetical protein
MSLAVMWTPNTGSGNAGTHVSGNSATFERISLSKPWMCEGVHILDGAEANAACPRSGSRPSHREIDCVAGVIGLEPPCAKERTFS